ncbi:methylated-DNA--[protein]-cysteine S-methyltransferase [Endozoicomonas euniceicola]|uniref:Methylated-DNA--[protein]-cysteine S-methyltransferase n=1 Tax=Endozoicomonas euniceicola TaxID=1234143 RepID=A0ABY6H2H3_9GAMM|nr:methylated-DNA--[protein]-cysteine S-methyltransferase [Endozoicomonas euniceicola]UYM18418.1 methylated-DNA--[protein]-cysteine S-methyltransferase [Endozoicomonas euniceicola]
MNSKATGQTLPLTTDIYFAVGECYLGAILVARNIKGICAISLGNESDKLTQDLQDRFPNANLIRDDDQREQLVAKVVGVLENPDRDLQLPLDIQGTDFQKRVWAALQDIPAGTTVSYTDIAEKIGAPKSVRAVAGACGANRLAIAIPCHRVVRRDGSLSGYRWGVNIKRQLLDKEPQISSC